MIPEQNFSNPNPYFKKVLPNSQAVFVLGILSIVLIFCCGGIGLILAIIAAVLGTQGKTLYNSAKNNYTLESFNQLNAGLIMSYISIGLNIASIIVFTLLYIAGKLN